MFKNSFHLLTQLYQLFIESPDGGFIIHLGSSIDLAVIFRRIDPRSTGGETGCMAVVPLHGSTAIITAALSQNLQSLFGGLAVYHEDPVVVQAFHIPVLVNGGIVRVGHANLFTLIDVGSTSHQMDGGSQHLGGFLPVFLLITQTAYDTRLVMVAPEHGVPAVLCLHTLLPGCEQFLQLLQVCAHQAPLVTILVVNLQMVEAEDHAQFLFLGSSVTDTIIQAGRGHLTNSSHVFDTSIVNVNAATASTVARESGFRSAFEGTGFELLETQYGEGDAAKSQGIAENYITQGVVGIFGCNEGSTNGAGNAVKAAGADVVCVGFDKSDAILGLIQDGYILATMAQNPDVMGAEGVKAAVAALNGENLGGAVTDTGVSVLTK